MQTMVDNLLVSIETFERTPTFTPLIVLLMLLRILYFWNNISKWILIVKTMMQEVNTHKKVPINCSHCRNSKVVSIQKGI